jgi:hypothetical protein
MARMDLPPAPSVITWPAPAGEPASPHYTLAVNGVVVFVCRAPVRAEIWTKPGLWSHRPGATYETRSPMRRRWACRRMSLCAACAGLHSRSRTGRLDREATRLS